MIILHKHIFLNICNKNIDTYEDFIYTLNDDYTNIIVDLSAKNITCHAIRQLIHKMVGLVAIFQDTNEEIMYMCKLILNIDKKSTNFLLYKEYVQWILLYDKRKLGLVTAIL